MSFLSRLFESKEARAERLKNEAEAKRLAESKRRVEEAEQRRLTLEAEKRRLAEEAERRRLALEAKKRQAEEAVRQRIVEVLRQRIVEIVEVLRQRIVRETEAKKRAEEEEKRRQRQRTCKKCNRVFEAVGGTPPNGGTCSHCGGIFCYSCMKSEFARQMERHPEKHDTFGVRRVQERSPLSSQAKSEALRQMMDMMQPETKVLSVADEVGGLPCPECLSVIWKRSARPL